jgi:hypothetical protein
MSPSRYSLPANNVGSTMEPPVPITCVAWQQADYQCLQLTIKSFPPEECGRKQALTNCTSVRAAVQDTLSCTALQANNQ